VAAGGHPIVEIMIPLTVSRAELALARSWVEVAIAEAMMAAPGRTTSRRKGSRGAKVGGGSLEVLIGTMIETPRAALRAAEIATEADFFSFGTNDLTQMTFGFSRDDVEGRMMSVYLEEGLLERNPFEVVDPDGVGELVRLGVERGRSTKPGLKIGICGEHGGDPESIATFAKAGLDYVSCSPFRVPIARLATAQAVLAGFTGSRPGGAPGGAKRAAKAAPKRVAKAAPKRVAKAAPKRVAKAAPKRAAKAAPKRVAKAAPKRVAKAAPKRVAKAAPKRAAKAKR
jgi:hypothetical protein